MSLNFNLHAASVLAPGLSSLTELFQACNGDRQINTADDLMLVASKLLPPNERRRSSKSVRLVLSCIEQLENKFEVQINNLRSVFATDDGVGEISQQMFDVLSTTRQVSPLVFPNSVHSAAAGLFSIAYKNNQPSTVVSRGVESFGAGLLCAVIDSLSTSEPVLFVSFDPAMTSPMNEQLPVNQPTASAWIISSGESHFPTLAKFKLTLENDSLPCTSLPSWIPNDWAQNSTAYGYVCLSLIERKQASSCRIRLGHQTLNIEVIDRSLG